MTHRPLTTRAQHALTGGAFVVQRWTEQNERRPKEVRIEALRLDASAPMTTSSPKL
jgi:hypothetical protein